MSTQSLAPLHPNAYEAFKALPDASSLPGNGWPAGESSHDLPQRGEKTKAVMGEFVEMLKDNAKVWAVCATADPDGINVWTYIDSPDRIDQIPIYRAQWRLMMGHPETSFGFNTAEVPAGGEEFNEDDLDFLYRR
ncbi:MAG TPA: hypothetical protein VMX16_01685 [Terriglobia bacterium]|nr:hypothetical protein [Terriglobia bacterium]